MRILASDLTKPLYMTKCNKSATVADNLYKNRKGGETYENE